MTIRHILTIAATTSIAACALTSCDWIKDDLSDCPECQGTLSVKIEHRYNMLHADAAPSRVEKADVFIRNTVTGETQHKAFDKAMLDASGYYADMEFSGAGTVCQDIDFCGLYKKYSFKLFFRPELTHNSDAFQAVLQAF